MGKKYTFFSIASSSFITLHCLDKLIACSKSNPACPGKIKSTTTHSYDDIISNKCTSTLMGILPYFSKFAIFDLNFFRHWLIFCAK